MLMFVLKINFEEEKNNWTMVLKAYSHNKNEHFKYRTQIFLSNLFIILTLTKNIYNIYTFLAYIYNHKKKWIHYSISINNVIRINIIYIFNITFKKLNFILILQK